MPKRILLTLLTVLIACASVNAQNSNSGMGRRGTDPMNVQLTDSIYQLHQLQQINHLKPEFVPGHTLAPSQPLGTVQQLFQGSKNREEQSEKPFTARQASAVCYTVSGRNFLYQDSLMMWTGIPAMTADGHILLSGQFANYNISPSRTSGGFCMKTDVQGNVIWSKLYDSSFHLGYDFINYFRVIELSNKDILLAGRTDNQYSGNADVIITRTDSTGNIIWTKTYQSRLWLGFNGSGDSFGFTDLKEDPANGDLFFVGNHWFSCVAVTKLNPATGSVVWSNAYDTYDSDYAFGLIINQGSMHLFQLGNGYYNQSRINITGINKSTGDSLFHKTYEQTGPTNTPRLYNVHQVQQLDNGHYLLAGPTTGYWEFPAFTGTKDLHHAGVIEFDQNFNYVTSYGFKNRVESNGYNTRVSFSKEGNGFFTMFDYISGYTGEALIALFRNKQIYHQRKRLHNNEGIPNETQMLSLSNGGFIGVKTMGDSARLAKDGSRVEYYRIHSSDTTSVCLGIKDSSTAFWNFSFTPVTYKLDSIRRNLFSESRVKTHVNFPFRTYTSPSCQVISHCDSLSVSSTSTVVCPGNTVTITVHKNKACGSNVPLSYDTTWITQVNRLNDSTWTFVMNNIGEGFIKASLMGCVMKEDSVRIQVLPVLSGVSLGPDKSLCQGNTILLNARKGYASYLWQDGSTDSTFIVTTPGTYHVAVTNSCGSVFSDTIIISAAPPIPFDAGPDRTKCNSDTLQLTAPSGFINYTWSNNYNISSLTSQSVVVNPLVDTAYYVKAEKTPGCFAYDTVRVKVNHSPQIDLGRDKSFCSGDSAFFDAGSGFQSYQWSSGQTSQQIVVKTSGLYSVIGTTAEGCKSYDTVSIVNVYPLPVITLDKAPGICEGSSKMLSPGSFTSYEWNTGATTPSITVDDIGKYSVIVTDGNGCQNADSTEIAAIYPLPKGFLPLDTGICSYGTLELKPLTTFNRYLWSTGSNASFARVSRPGTYWLEVTDINACKGRDTVVVNPKDCMSGFYAPSAFSPNGDRKNDDFKPLLFGVVKTYQLTIYNRWGEIIFYSTDPFKGWGGKVGGIPQPTGVFVWTCTYQMEGEEMKREKGTITLIQ